MVANRIEILALHAKHVLLIKSSHIHHLIIIFLDLFVFPMNIFNNTRL